MGQSTRLCGPTRASNINIAENVSGASAAILPALQAITGTAETVISDPGVLANALTLSLPPGGPCEQEIFEVVASGYVKTTQSSTVVFKLYSGTSLTPGSDTLLGSTSSATVATTTVPWFIRCRLMFDSVSGKLIGTFSGFVGATITTEAAISGTLPLALSLNNANNPVISFVLSVTFGTGATANTVNVKDFGINH